MMRQLHILRILTGLLVGLCGQIFYQIIFSPAALPLSGRAGKCLPCEDPNKIRGAFCPFCGPETVTAANDPNLIEAYKPKGMYEVTRWYYFDEEYLYDIINGEPKVKLLGSWYEETRAVIQVALEYVNANRMLGKTWSLVGLENGYLRSDVFRGTDYILDLAVKSVESHPSESMRSSFRVRLVHAFEEKGKGLRVTSHEKGKDVAVHIVVPLSGTATALHAFLRNFMNQAEKHAQALKLTLVLFQGKGQFGEDSMGLKMVVEEYIRKFPDILIEYIQLEGDYDYLRGVKHAVSRISKLDIILTLKVDMHFGDDLLQTCKLITKLGKRTYFPIAFSQYDPDIIERGMPPGKPKNINKMDINKFTGQWLHKQPDFICAYNQDLAPTLDRVLLAVHSGIKKDDSGEGGKRVYDAFLASNIDVISAVEPDLIRIFRQRKCDKTRLSSDKYLQCFRTAAEMLGSKPALSILYLTEIAAKKV